MTTDQQHNPETGRSLSVLSAGFGTVLVACYGILALAATARSAYQIATKFDQAPLAYTLSAFAAVVYIVATVALVAKGHRWYWVAVITIGIEFAGVLIVGVLSLFVPALQGGATGDHATVWSVFGMGYGFIPLILPIIGLWWLWRHRQSIGLGGAVA